MSVESTANAAEQVFERFDKLYEFDREPVSQDRLEPGRHFAAVFAGEHVAGTEFVIGALFVTMGVSAKELLFGLLVGNLFAVLSWTLVCAPIAVETRLTLYWYLRRIAGPAVTTIYNVLNAVMFCILSGTMITVSASSVRIPFGIPPQIKWYPEDPRFVLIVLAVGAVVVVVAIAGFRRLAQFNEVCVPWIFVMFFAGAVAMLPALAETAGNGTQGNKFNLWRLANETIWVKNSSTGIGFWHVVAFAWICNLAMHVGLSDMALLRFAKRPAYALYSACGMFLGHYLAWVCAGVMGAAVAVVTGVALDKLDAGGVAHTALGVSGAIAVVLAGWSTSNPTLYRAGLALQAVTPGWPRWLVTLAAGAFTTIIACFPFVFSRLLEFVALYGILLMPIGAIVFVEHYLFPKIGLQQYWLHASGRSVNWPALVSWFGAVAIACGVYHARWMHLFFVPLPLWFLTAAVYTALAARAGAAGGKQNRGVEWETGRKGSFDFSATRESPPRPLSPSPPLVRPWMVSIVGAIALFALLACVALPFWVVVNDSRLYADRLASYRVWLAWASITHLAACAVWVAARLR
jgi:NCS1 family nucleobase:cation symporter-1